MRYVDNDYSKGYVVHTPSGKVVELMQYIRNNLSENQKEDMLLHYMGLDPHSVETVCQKHITDTTATVEAGCVYAEADQDRRIAKLIETYWSDDKEYDPAEQEEQQAVYIALFLLLQHCKDLYFPHNTYIKLSKLTATEIIGELTHTPAADKEFITDRLLKLKEFSGDEGEYHIEVLSTDPMKGTFHIELEVMEYRDGAWRRKEK